MGNLINKKLRRGIRFVTPVALVVMIAGLCQGWAAPPQSNIVNIVSDRFEAYQQKQQVIFIGHVVATQGDVTVRGDRMTIFYLRGDAAESENKDLGRRIDRIAVEGNVRISQKNTLATGNHAVYYSSDNKVVLTGEPKVQRDNDFIQGHTITLFLDTDKSVVEGGPSGPVEANIYSSKTGGSIDRSGVEGVGRSGTDRDAGG